MLSKSWIDNAALIEPPMVCSVNFQVRTGISAPFEPHMTGEDTSAEEAEEKVRIPAADFMASDE